MVFLANQHHQVTTVVDAATSNPVIPAPSTGVNYVKGGSPCAPWKPPSYIWFLVRSLRFSKFYVTISLSARCHIRIGQIYSRTLSGRLVRCCSPSMQWSTFAWKQSASHGQAAPPLIVQPRKFYVTLLGDASQGQPCLVMLHKDGDNNDEAPVVALPHRELARRRHALDLAAIIWGVHQFPRRRWGAPASLLCVHQCFSSTP